MRHVFFICACFLLAGIFTCKPAESALRVCNKTDHAASVAIGFFDGKDWSSQGWWTVAPAGCSELVGGSLNARYYYLYAIHQDVGGAWDGDRGFCTVGQQFRIPGRANCQGRSYERSPFFQIDTGDAPDWTENLED